MVILIGGYSKSVVSNYMAGVRAWHLIHQLPWNMPGDYAVLLSRAAVKCAPVASLRRPREPYTIENLRMMAAKFNKEDPRNVAVWACTTSLFFGIGRTGELTVPTHYRKPAFNPEKHPTPAQVTHGVHRDTNQPYTRITLPWSKARKDKSRRDEISWVPQGGDVDPHTALQEHMWINSPRDDEHLFTYVTEGGDRRALTCEVFQKRIKEVCTAAGVPFKQCHGFRIGGTLEYLLRGVPCAEVQVMGRWASKAFLLYLRRHAEVLTPYMQPQPNIHGDFIRHVLPPVR